VDAASGATRSFHIASTITALAYSPTGTLLAVGTATAILLVDASDGAVLRTAPSALGGGHVVVANGGIGIDALAFSPDGRELAANDMAGVALWSIPGLHEHQLVRYPGVGTSMIFTPDARKLVVGGYSDNSFRVYALPSGRLVRLVNAAPRSLIGNLGPTVLAMSADARELAVGYTVDAVDGEVSVFATSSWTKQADVAQVHNVAISALAFSPDGTRLAIGAADGTAGVWSLANHDELAAYDGATAVVTATDFTPGGNSVITASNDGTTRLWGAQGADQALVPIDGTVHLTSVTRRRLDVVAQAGKKLTLYTFRMPGGNLLRTLPVGTTDSISGVLAADGRLAVTYDAPDPLTGVPARGPIRIVDVATDKVVKTLPPAGVFQSALSPDDSRLFLQVQEAGIPNGIGEGEVVTLANGHMVPLQTETPCGSYPAGMVFSADDAEVAGESFCGIVDVWNARTGQLLRALNEGGQVSSIDLSPDGSRLLVSSWDSRATIWSVATGQPLVTLIGHTRGLNGAAFAAKGSLVVTTSLDDTVRVWNSRTGQELRVLSFGAFQGTLAVSPDGSLVAVTEMAPDPGDEDVVRVFTTCPDCQNAAALLRLATRRIPPVSRLTTLERTVVASARS
jgi:WD40 repeat protein